LSTKKEHPPPPQTETSTNTPKVTPHLMNSSFKTIPPFPVSSSRSKKEDKKKRDFRGFQESKTQHSSASCYQANSQVCQILEGVVYYQESFQTKRS